MRSARGIHPLMQVLLLVAPVVFYSIFIARSAFQVGRETYFSLFDDAMISMRFARHLAEGHGLTWNIGEAPVEGYTNFLWTLWMALFHLLPVAESKISLLVMLSGVVVLYGLLGAVWSITRRVAEGSRLTAGIAVLLVAFYYPLVFWTLRGMEVGALAFLLYAAIALAFHLQERFRYRYVWGAALLMTLAVLMRLDALVPVGFLAVYTVLVLPRARRGLGLALVAAACLLPLVGQTLFRVTYYHDWLPNTYYLKVTGVTLAERLVRGLKVFLQSYAYHLYPYVMMLPILFLRPFRQSDVRLIFLAALAVLQVAYSIYVGGDAWEWSGINNRFLTLAMPAVAILVALAITTLMRSCRSDEQTFFRAAQWAVSLVAAAVVTGALLQFLSPRFEGPWGMLLAGVWFGLGLLGLGVGARLTVFLNEKNLPAAALALAVAVTLSANGWTLVRWLKDGGLHVQDDASASRLGVFLRQATQPEAVIAVIWAGAIPYFSQRPTLDLLGKCDPVIAKGPVAAKEFFPGHNKWNFSYSIGERRPDVIVQYLESPENNQALERWGYERLPNGVFVRRDTPAVRGDFIGQDWRVRK